MNNVSFPHQTQSNAKLYLSDVEVARYLNISVATIRRWRLNGAGPRFRKIGACVRYGIADLEAYIAKSPSGGERGAA